MRLLHTSDWHLGQTLHQFERHWEHAQFLDWLLETLVAESIDGLLIVGDVFDNTNPSASAQTQLYRFLTAARQRVPHLNILMTAGNHDSPARLEVPTPFLSLLGAHVVGQLPRTGPDAQPQVPLIPLRDRSGAIAAWCIAMPFLRPADLPRIETAADPYQAGVAQLYQQGLAQARQQRRAGQAILALGHCHLRGTTSSIDSERCLVIGGAEALSSDIFPADIAYVALGHLHLAQTVGGDPTRRYCGSPLPMSFAEIHYPHQVVVFDLEGEQACNIREIRIPRAIELLRVPPSPASLATVLSALQALQLPERPETAWPYLQVRVQLSQPEPGLRAQIEAALMDKPVRLARIETTLAHRHDAATPPRLSIDEIHRLAPANFFERLYQHRFGTRTPPALMAAFNELLNTLPAEMD